MPRRVMYDMAYVRQHIPIEVWTEWLAITINQPGQTAESINHAIDAFQSKHGDGVMRHIKKARCG